MTRNVQIIIIPGIMGSVLKQGEAPLWPFSDYIPNAREKLKNINDPEIKPKRLIGYTYSNLVDALEDISGNVTPFFYDWRINNLKQLSLLEEKIDKSADEIIIVAHSMGGIIGKLFLNYYRESEFYTKISKFITLGTPWNGAMDAYKTLKYGKAIPEKSIFRGRILNPNTSREIAEYFPSFYQLFPSRNYCELSTKIEKRVLVSYRIDQKNYYDHDEFFVDHLKEVFVTKGHNYSEVFEDYYELLTQPISTNIKQYELIGVGNPTIAGITENSLGEAEGDYRDGDGTVPLFSAYSELENTFFLSKVDHMDLPKDEDSIELVQRIIRDNINFIESKKVFNNLNSEFNQGFSGKIIKVACPVTVSLENEDGQVIYGAIDTIDEEGLTQLAQHEFNIQQLGTTTYIFLDEDSNEEELDKIIIHAYDEGPTSISIDQYVKGNYIKRSSFKTFNINNNITAELSVSKKIEENRLKIEKANDQPYYQEPSIIEVTSEVEMPITKGLISANHILEHSNAVFTKGPIYFNLESVSQGSYQVESTFIVVNGKASILEGDAVLLDLTEGEHFIEYFSKDVFGNIEAANKIKIVVMPDKSLFFKLEFLSHQYSIYPETSLAYSKIHHAYGFEEKPIFAEGNNDKKAFGNIFLYGVPQRSIVFTFENIFGELERYQFNIEEDVILQIFEGTATEQNLKDFIGLLGISQYSTKFMVPPSEGKTKKRITNEHISKSYEIIIEGDNSLVKIIKNSKYEVSFQNLAEDIIIGKGSKFSLFFKVLNKKLNSEMRTLNLEFFTRIYINDDEIITENEKVNFDDDQDAYLASINLTKLEKLTQAYWKTIDIIQIEFVVVDMDSNGHLLRSQNIYIRKS